MLARKRFWDDTVMKSKGMLELIIDVCHACRKWTRGLYVTDAQCLSKCGVKCQEANQSDLT